MVLHSCWTLRIMGARRTPLGLDRAIHPSRQTKGGRVPLSFPFQDLLFGAAIPPSEDAPLISRTRRGMAQLQQCCTCLASAKANQHGLAFANSPGSAIGDSSIPVSHAATHSPLHASARS